MKIRVADFITQYLVQQHGLTTTFMLSGGGMMHLIDAVGRQEGLNYLCNHHEQSGAIAADAYARVSGRLGVCYATSGPGGTNTITGVVGAFQDSSPVLYISGQSKVSQTIRGTHLEGLRQFGTFEVDIIPIVESITKYAAFVDDPKKIRYHLEKACYLALSGRPGPVFLDIPIEVQGAYVESNELEGFEIPMPQGKMEFDANWLLDKLNSAKRPVILAGHGIRCSGKAEEFLKLVELIKIPVVTTPFAADLMPFDHELFIGHPGMKGDRAGNLAVQTADLLVVLGSSLHVTTTGYELDLFAPNAEVIFIDPDEMVHKRQQVDIDHKIQCEVGFAITELVNSAKKTNQTPDSQWQQLYLKWKSELAVNKEQRDRKDDEIDFYDVVDKLSTLSIENDIIVSDAGSAFYVVGQAFRTKPGQRIISSGSLGAMGFAIPAASGASVAAPNQRVLCVTGDGSLMTNVHELATIRKFNLNVKLIIVNNGGYISIRNTQNNFFEGFLVGSSDDSGVFIPSLKKLAAAFELPYVGTNQETMLDKTLKEALETEGPVVCEIITPKDQKITPTVSSVKLADGTMRSRPLHDMAPFLDSDVLKSYLPQGIELERPE